MQEDGDDVLFFVQTWAEAVVRRLDRVRELREKGAVLFRQAERADMEVLDLIEEDSRRNFRVQWAEEHMLIWAAHQLEQWNRRLAAERGEEPPQPDRVLARVSVVTGYPRGPALEESPNEPCSGTRGLACPTHSLNAEFRMFPSCEGA